MLSLILMLTMNSLMTAPKSAPMAEVKLAQIETCQWPRCSRPSQRSPFVVKSFRAQQIETCQWPRCFKAG